MSPPLSSWLSRRFLPPGCATILSGERLTTLGIVGLVVGFLGVGVLSNPDPGNLLNPRTVSLFLVVLGPRRSGRGCTDARRFDEEETVIYRSVVDAARCSASRISFGVSESVADDQWTTDAVLALCILLSSPAPSASSSTSSCWSASERSKSTSSPTSRRCLRHSPGGCSAEIPTVYTVVGFVVSSSGSDC